MCVYICVYVCMYVDPETLSDRFIGEGLAASAGAACGVLAFTCEDAEEFRKNKVNCILCR